MNEKKHSQYVNENGEIKMCSSCRKVKSGKETVIWILDTILYVEPPENVSYETCPECTDK